MKNLKPLLILFFVLLSAVLVIVWVVPKFKKGRAYTDQDRKGGVEMVEINYGHTIDSVCRIFNLPPAYFKALCMLECSGRKAFDQRFESHVYERLQSVKLGRLDNYEHVTPQMLNDAGDEALRNLASSWGPFQLMGYKCLLLDIKVRDIRGDDGVYHAIRWMDMTYGNYLRDGKFKDAFHMHNTGKPYPSSPGAKPQTYDPDYCGKGLRYMKKFGYQFN